MFIRNALQWKAVAQGYRNHSGTMQDVDARRYGALFFTRIPGGFLFKSVAEGGTSLAFVPENEDTKRMEELHLERHPGDDEKKAIDKYERQMFGMQESGAEAQEVEEWLLRFHDQIQPDDDDRVRAAHALIDALEKLDGKGGISVRKEHSKPWSPSVTIAGEGPVTVRYSSEKKRFLIIDKANSRTEVDLTYDPVTKSYRGPAPQGRRGPPGIRVIVEAAWSVIQSQKNEDDFE